MTAIPEVHVLPSGQVAVRIGEVTWWVIEPEGRDHAVYELPDDAVRLVPDETNDDALMAYGMKWQAERAAGIPSGSITAAESVTGNYLMNYDPKNGDLHALARDIVAEIAGALVVLPTDSPSPDGAGAATPADAEMDRLREDAARWRALIQPHTDEPVEPDDPERLQRRLDELIDRLIAERMAKRGEPLAEVDCPACGATIRARMADASPPSVEAIAAALHEDCTAPVDYVIGLECASNHRGSATRVRALLVGGDDR